MSVNNTTSQITITPISALIDEPVQILLYGFAPNIHVTLHARTKDDANGEDDRLWPSTIYSNMVVDRLTKHNFPHSYIHLKFKGAGHFVGIPYSFPNLPPSIVPLFAGPMILQFGGNLKDSAFADADSWHHVLAFLQESFGAPETAQTT